ncbi:molybdopterin-binding protein [Fulvivirga sp. M361]|uniref:FAD binding domain-containing protein n=1 Tax=Fulvivirga sp. M361 TaxID=2594266 RepID=UPI00117B8CE6|nr:FAD binding domain-containing protein [Fulvivirga sp. M361]TRX60078.1 molybdopterin-binding protein [Fulvivirga sp. M361]
MNNFSWYDATTLKEAQNEADTTVSDMLNKDKKGSSIIKSGGIDVMDLMKEGLITPEKIVNIRNIPGLDKIEFDTKKGVRIGANVTLSDIEKNSVIRDNYQALQLSVSKAATPQLRNMSTIAGNLGQRTRCWYFRSVEHDCLRKGGSTCFAKNGENDYHAVMNNGSCASVHASSIATALLAFGAVLEIALENGEKKEVPIENFFVTPYENIKNENVLKSGEIITAIVLPAVNNKTKSYYIKQGARQSYDWALADVAVVVELSGKKCKNARIALGAASPVPIRANSAESILTNEGISESSAKAAAEAAMEKATPLEKNAYKVAIFKSILQRAILKTV